MIVRPVCDMRTITLPITPPTPPALLPAQTVDRVYTILRERNIGTLFDGRTFGEVMHYFVIGGDESCLLASNGEVRIIGDKEKKKHEVKTADSRTSITLYRTGSAAGADGPTAFLPPGAPMYRSPSI